jgi:hypothetical protein
LRLGLLRLVGRVFRPFFARYGRAGAVSFLRDRLTFTSASATNALLALLARLRQRALANPHSPFTSAKTTSTWAWIFDLLLFLPR